MFITLVDGAGNAIDRDTVWSPAELAKFLGSTVNVTHVWRVRGTGPDYDKGANGRAVEYKVGAVIDWLNNRKPWSRPAAQKAA